ncbi:MAG: thymidine phosphorylase [Oligoflexales bacterium]|nr:thymidine phosphorylase [Oligoflexales bacterium]
MLPQELIFKKQNGSKLTSEELGVFFADFLKGKVFDYQVSAFLMSCYFQGMSIDEVTELTLIAKNSGRVFEWKGIDPQKVIDKHSTGGVGDKTSLILYPLCILEGLKVPMVSGRSLGHTGGTIDKLESIPGMYLNISMDQAEKQLYKNGGFIMSQTDELAPLDRKLYAIRDVCSIVASVPLITASILSKKLAEGISGLVLDVKFGSGAFLTAKEEALELANSLREVANRCGLQVEVSLNSMDSPLGKSAGNALEVIECCDVLKGKGPEDTRNLSVNLAAKMVKLAYPQRCIDEIRKKLMGYLENGQAFDKFCELLSLQGADVRYLENPEKLLGAPLVHSVFPESEGLVSSCDVRKLGLAVTSLGGGRTQVGEVIDHTVGLANLKHVGDLVSKNEPLAYVYAKNQTSLDTVSKMVLDSYRIIPSHS